MKSEIAKMIMRAAFAAAFLAAAFQTASFAQELNSGDDREGEARGRGGHIVGVWIVQVTRRDCNTGDPIGAPFESQNTFALGGTLLETVAPSLARSLGNGLWKLERGRNEFSLAQRFMRFNPATGAYIGSNIVRATNTLDDTGDRYTSVATNDLLDLNGNVVGSGCATSVGTRFVPE